MEIRMQIDGEFLESMMAALDMKGTDVVREALTMLNWAVKEIRRGRVILSADQRGRNTMRLAMPSLERLAAGTPLVARD